MNIEYKYEKFLKMENILPSLIGTFFAEIFTLPICTVKTVYQINSNLTIQQTIQQIYQR